MGREVKIFLDLDGVVCNFLHGAASLFERDYDHLLANWPRGVYNTEEVIGVSKSQFFKKIKERGADFWANLPEYPYTREFYDHCVGLAPTYFLTRPTYDPGCLSGKLEWLHKWHGSGFTNYIMTTHKHLCAAPYHILIDDHVENVEKFIEHGGKAILWPTICNQRHDEANNAVEVVKQELDKHIRS